MRALRLILQVAWRMIRVSPRRYALGGALLTLFWITPLLGGLVLKALFDHLSQGVQAGLDNVLWLCAAFVAAELLRGGVFLLGIHFYMHWWVGSSTVLQSNVLRSVLTARGPAAGRLPHSSGEAVSRLRDDVRDLVLFTDNLIDILGVVLFGTTALIIMGSIDPLITLVLILPLLALIVIFRMVSVWIRRVHARARALGAVVTSYIGEIFGGVLAIKTSGAEAATMARLREHNRRRRHAAVRDRLAMDMIDTLSVTGVELSVGLVLLLAAPAMRRGEFTVGDFALFTSYLGMLTMLPRFLGRMLYRIPQGGVAIERLTRLMADHESAKDLSRPRPLWFDSDPPSAMTEAPARTDELQSLTVRGLTVRHPGTDRGVFDVDLTVRRGSFTVITGAVGAGKTTLVRGLLGLLPAEAGTISWNGRPVADPGTFLVPSRVAYASQVPRLFSAGLGENLRLGWPASDEQLHTAVRLATFEDDLAAMPDGLDTLVGARGVRLSGGQVQRATAARALIRRPDLLVVDDLSSALDVRTEQELWERLAEAAGTGHGPQTLLVVSHRRAALERADQIVVLDRGYVVGTGSLPELLLDCPEMRRLWREESIEGADETSAVAVTSSTSGAPAASGRS